MRNWSPWEVQHCSAWSCLTTCQAGQGQGTASSMWVAQSSLWVRPMKEGGVECRTLELIQQAVHPVTHSVQPLQLVLEDRICSFWSKLIFFFCSIIILSRITFLFFNKLASGCHGSASATIPSSDRRWRDILQPWASHTSLGMGPG